MAMMRRYLTDEEQRKLLAAVRLVAGLDKVDTEAGAQMRVLAARDWAWIKALLETGMRVGELAWLELAQAKHALATGWLCVRGDQRKGANDKPGRAHEYVVTEPLRRCLVLLVRLQGELRPMGVAVLGAEPLMWGRPRTDDGGHLVVGHISVRSLQDRMKVWLRLASLDQRVSPHWMRHSRGVNVMKRSRGGNPLKSVQLALGHASIASSGIYTQMLREDFVRDMHQVAGGRVPKALAVAMAGEVAHG